jgi:hypothetical protein
MRDNQTVDEFVTYVQRTRDQLAYASLLSGEEFEPFWIDYYFCRFPKWLQDKMIDNNTVAQTAKHADVLAEARRLEQTRPQQPDPKRSGSASDSQANRGGFHGGRSGRGGRGGRESGSREKDTETKEKVETKTHETERTTWRGRDGGRDRGRGRGGYRNNSRNRGGGSDRDRKDNKDNSQAEN